MKILIDECLPRRLKTEMPGHEVITVPEMGWAGTKNGELLRLMTGRFDVFLTIDSNLSYQQNLEARQVSVIVLSAPNNKLETLKPLLPNVLRALETLAKGEVVRITGA
ncbi:MAG: DUF5615 family PIN-like protein [Anaerolineae bacterium]|nr:DUF5615 family PIN-like protein [Anaerolineae bacterium]